MYFLNITLFTYIEWSAISDRDLKELVEQASRIFQSTRLAHIVGADGTILSNVLVQLALSLLRTLLQAKNKNIHGNNIYQKCNDTQIVTN